MMNGCFNLSSYGSHEVHQLDKEMSFSYLAPVENKVVLSKVGGQDKSP